MRESYPNSPGLIQSLISWGKNQGMQDFYLEAYAENNSALKAYEKLGFKKLKAMITDIGEGFIMDDFLLEKVL